MWHDKTNKINILNALLTSSEDSSLPESSSEDSFAGSFAAGTPFLAGAARVPFLAAPAGFFVTGS